MTNQTEPPPPPRPADKAAAKYQDSNKLSVEVSKQFITLALAGIGFVIGMLISDPPKLPPSYFGWALVPLIISAVLGLLFLMRVVGEIRNSNNYDAYSDLPRTLAGFQILIFVFAIGALGVATVGIIRKSPVQAKEESTVEIDFKGKHIKHSIAKDTDLKVRILNDNDINIEVVPKK